MDLYMKTSALIKISLVNKHGNVIVQAGHGVIITHIIVFKHDNMLI